jgi:hypothetical protein
MFELHFELGKINEKKSNLTSESFESVRAIKLYGWDKYFHEEIMKYMKQQKNKEEDIQYIDRSI